MIECFPFVLSLPVLSKVEGSKHELSFFSNLASVEKSLLLKTNPGIGTGPAYGSHPGSGTRMCGNTMSISSDWLNPSRPGNSVARFMFMRWSR